MSAVRAKGTILFTSSAVSRSTLLSPSLNLRLAARLQVIELRPVCGQEEIPVGLISGGVARHLFEPCEEGYGVERHLNIDGRGELGADAARAFRSRPHTLLLFPLDDQNVRAARFREVVSDARTHDAAAYDYDLRCFVHRAVVRFQSPVLKLTIYTSRRLSDNRSLKIEN